MAKSSIRKNDPIDTTAPGKRRRTSATEGVEPQALKTPRTRRKADAVAAAEPVSNALAGTNGNGANGHGEATPDVPHEQIAVRVYHIYLERGYAGDSFLDWVTAERELREQFGRARG